ncbi:hypothetical protein FCIRC_2727 [Fusarium circinatum]|uniref:Uncharacterized protein n=1 Tax=Fusarium circinatum TaxID=48490 RepID=A0A8H5UDJ9_FUSCI|nr:hypothetical protein FCIRC_2727 [Fusarium circinatum]
MYKASLLLRLCPMPDSQLTEPNGRYQVHIQDCIVSRFRIGIISRDTILVALSFGRFPEGGPLRLEQTGSWNNNIDSRELFQGLLPSSRQLWPRCNVSFLKQDPGFAIDARERILLQELLSFGPQFEIGNEDRTSIV